jgi:hypothetical protein
MREGVRGDLDHWIRDQRPGLDLTDARAGTTDKRGQDVSEPGQTGQPSPEAGAWVRGRERGSQI